MTHAAVHREDRGGLSLSSIEPAAERQPGGRAPAPGQLRLVQSFVNSRWDLDRNLEEQLANPAALAGWLVARRLVDPGARIGSADLERALEVREGLRELLFVNNGAAGDARVIERLNLALEGPGLFVQLDPRGPARVPVQAPRPRRRTRSDRDDRRHDAGRWKLGAPQSLP